MKNSEVKIDTILADYTIDPPDKTVEKTVKKVLADKLGVNVDQSAITYSDGTVRIAVDPTVRSRIHISKPNILQALDDRLKKKVENLA